MSTRVITTVAEMKAFALEVRARGKSLALVPTMGALHEGHLGLVHQAKRQTDVVVVSIYVNPKQFGPQEDFDRYPRDLNKDIEALTPLKVDAAFAPCDAEMYPEGFGTRIEPGEIAKPLEGATRPGHFHGVTTVVLKLFNIVHPDVAYFGQKDIQQVQVIRRMVEDLNLDVRLVICPTAREPDGLARSSRNTYLGPEDRRAALALLHALRRAEQMVHGGETDAEKLLDEMHRVVAAEPRAQLDYAAVVDPTRLEPLRRVTAGSVAVVAARVGGVHLIDNVILGPSGSSAELLLQLALTARPVMDTGARLPGLEADALRMRIEVCRDCAAVSAVLLPPHEFLVKYLKRDYADLNAIKIVVIARDSPLNADHFIYRRPADMHRFAAGLYELIGVRDFAEFKSRFALTDAIRCHSNATRAPEKALANCVRHLRDELKLFPGLETLIVLGEDAYLQFQRHILGRDAPAIPGFDELLKEQGWAKESVCLPDFDGRAVTAFYCHHPTYGYKRTPSIAKLLG